MTNSGGDDSGRWQEIANILGADSRDELSDYFGGTTKRTSDAEGPVEIEIEAVEEVVNEPNADESDSTNDAPVESSDVQESVEVEVVKTADELEEADLLFTSDEPVRKKRPEKKSKRKPAASESKKQPVVEPVKAEEPNETADAPGHWNDLASELGLEPVDEPAVSAPVPADEEPIACSEPVEIELEPSNDSDEEPFFKIDDLEDDAEVLDSMFESSDQPKSDSNADAVTSEDSPELSDDFIEYEVEDLGSEDKDADDRRRRRKSRRGRRGRGGSSNEKRGRGDQGRQDSEVDGEAGEDSMDVDPRDLDPRDMDPRDLDPRDLDPRDVDPRDVDPRDVDPRDIDPRGQEGRGRRGRRGRSRNDGDRQEAGSNRGGRGRGRGRGNREQSNRDQGGRDQGGRDQGGREVTGRDGNQDGPQEGSRERSRNRRNRNERNESSRNESRASQSSRADHSEDDGDDRKKKAKKNIPTWSEAVETIVDLNLSNRKKSSGNKRRRGRNN